MPSPPITGANLARLRAGHQAVRWRAKLGVIVQFRAFCCDTDANATMGVSKTPVPVLHVSPNPVCLGDAVAWDLRNSYAPGPDAIISHSIDMGDGTQYFVDHGSHVYASAGTYTVVGTVDTGLRSQSANIQVEVVDCSEPMLITFAYASQDGGGVWFIDFTNPSPAWEQRSNGLEGTALNVNALALRPGDKRLPNTVHELYVATDGGLYRTRNGGRFWAKVDLPDPSNAEFVDVPPATVDQLTFHDIVYSQEDPNVVWVLASSPTPRVWVYATGDNGLTWASRGLVTS